MQWAKTKPGFTIVELLIVVVVIAILAAITVVSYNGIQARSQTSKINADIANLEKAILAARINRGEVALRYISGSVWTGGGCWGKATGTDLASLPTSDGCWTSYANFLNAVSNASGINVRNLVDPWGRPYYVDENESEGPIPATACTPDSIGYYSRPFTTGQTMTTVKRILLIQPGCA
jgi:prepilin-type N-terminal cleavage/methylation domain-containing protein